ncbi:MAG: MFS transporter [Nitrospiraceae bacterium]|nr:MFS transporter [Nitrospiraceae bacterium]
MRNDSSRKIDIDVEFNIKEEINITDSGLTSNNSVSYEKHSNLATPLGDSFFKKDRNLRLLIDSSVPYSLMTGFGESYIGAFAVFLNATPFQISLISSIPRLISAFLQLLSRRVIYWFKNSKNALVVFMIFQAFMWPYFLMSFFVKNTLLFYFIFVCLYFVFSAFISSIWTSFAGEFIPSKLLGRFFGVRNKLINLTLLISFILSGYILTKFKLISHLNLFGVVISGNYAGFVVVFMVAFFARLVSVIYIRLVRFSKESEVFDSLSIKNLFHKFRRISKTKFGHFAFYKSYLVFSVFFAAPFFDPLFLRVFKFNYLEYVSFSLVPVFVKVVSSKAIGLLADKYGNVRLFKLAAFLVPFSILPFVFFKSFMILISFTFVMAIVWTIYDVSSMSLVFYLSDKKERSVYASMFNLEQGVAASLGALCGGFFFNFLSSFAIPVFFVYSGIFLISFTLRFFGYFFISKFLKDDGDYRPIAYPKLVVEVFRTIPQADVVFIPKTVAFLSRKGKKPFFFRTNKKNMIKK